MAHADEIRKMVRGLAEEAFGPSPFEIGDRVKHPSGRTVEIVGGAYWGEFGMSNFWTWREVRADGTLVERRECGYGWRP